MEILKGTYQTMINLLFKAKQLVIFSAPNIADEMAEALVTIKAKGINVQVFIEFSEYTYRAGFGDITSIKILRDGNIDLHNKSGINIYFLTIDDAGYFYFPKSHFFEKEGITYDLFPMEKAQVKFLKLLYNLLDDEDSEFEDLIDNIGIEKLSEISKGLQRIDEKKSIELENKLKIDPPLKPNLGRTLEVYKAKFQIAELKFKGANLHVKKIKLPRKALPFKDDKLKRSIEANLRLFTDIPEKEFLEPFFNLKIELDAIRDQFLFYIKSRDKNIIIREKKGDFKEAIKSIIEKIEDIKSDLLNTLQEEINNSRQRIKINLFDFLKDNPPEDFFGLKDKVLENEIRNATNKVISAIRFPKSKDLLKEMKLEYHFYDITWEDLNNKEVLEELQKHELINKDQKSYIDELAIGAEKVK